MGLSASIAPGFEADDIIGTYTRMAQEKGMDVIIFSGDKDFMQFLDSKTKMLITHKGGVQELIGEEGVIDKLGVKSSQVVDFLSLLGDSADNVPGAPGVGKVTASKLLQEHGSLDVIFEKAHTFKKKGLTASLLENKEQILLSRELVKIKLDMELPEVEGTHFKGFEMEALKPYLEKMEFTKILSRLGVQGTVEAVSDHIGNIEHSYTAIKTKEHFEKLIQTLSLSDNVAFYPCIENGVLLGLSLCRKENKAVYIPLGKNALQEFGLESVSQFLDLVFEKPYAKFITHDAKGFLHLLLKNGLEESISGDTYLQATVLEPGKAHYELEKISEQIFDYKMIELGKSGNKKRAFFDLDEEGAVDYACERCDKIMSLFENQKSRLEKLELSNVYQAIELPLLFSVVKMESHGVALNSEELSVLSKETELELDDLTQKIHSLAGEEFNINSPKQLGPILFEKLKLQEELGLKKIKKTKTGYSTDSSVLESLKEHPIGEALLRYRLLSKLKSTYIDALPNEINPETGRVHSTYFQNGTATGRMSSQSPNLQNIPTRSLEGAKIRAAFIPSDNSRSLIAADYSQIELRVLAHFSQDESMAEAFKREEDIHSATAAKIFDCSLESVTKQQRIEAKAVNFGLLYGMGPKKLATDTGISMTEAKAFIQAYFDSFPSIKKFMDSLVEEARASGSAITLSGRKRPLPGLDSSNGMLRSAAENMALNTPIQGSAADLIKWAMLRLDRRIQRENLDLRITMQVHDELVFDLPTEKAEEYRKIIVEEMERIDDLPVKFDIPLKVDANIASNWLEAH
jgi:DNA polymerase-1